MSYTRETYAKLILTPVSQLHSKTMRENDVTNILNNLNVLMDIREGIIACDEDIGEFWNEIVSDVIASIHSATAGFYRQAVVTLRSVLEVASYSFFYYDHKIEYYIFKNCDQKADKYVSTLVNEHMFFTTKYIQVFYPAIVSVQRSENSVSNALKILYGELSDFVHGRYKYLTKTDGLEIKYDKELFKFYERKLFELLSLISIMYVLRCNNVANAQIIKLSKLIGVVNL